MYFNTKNINNYLCRNCYQNSKNVNIVKPVAESLNTMKETYKPICDWCHEKYDYNKSYKHCLSCVEKIDWFRNNCHPNGYHFHGYYLQVVYTRKQFDDELPKKMTYSFQVPTWMTRDDFINDRYVGSKYIFEQVIDDFQGQYEFDDAILYKGKSISYEMFGQLRNKCVLAGVAIRDRHPTTTPAIAKTSGSVVKPPAKSVPAANSPPGASSSKKASQELLEVDWDDEYCAKCNTDYKATEKHVCKA